MPTIEELQAELEGERAKLTGAQARISELNNESRGHRLNAQNARTEADKHKADLEAATTAHGVTIAAAELKAAEALKTAQAARKDAALRLAAKDAGMVDLDGLKLLDANAVTVADDGAVTIPEKYFETAKAAKPWLFGTPSTSSTAQTPKPAETKAKSARDMTPEEYRVARGEMLRGR